MINFRVLAPAHIRTVLARLTAATNTAEDTAKQGRPLFPGDLRQLIDANTAAAEVLAEMLATTTHKAERQPRV